MKIEPANGYGVAVGGKLDVRTVSPTRRAAIVNWLCLSGYAVLNSATDADIEQGWINLIAGYNLTVYVYHVTIQIAGEAV